MFQNLFAKKGGTNLEHMLQYLQIMNQVNNNPTSPYNAKKQQLIYENLNKDKYN